MRVTYFLSLWCLIYSVQIQAQTKTYYVNTEDDLEDGHCDSIHCSLREAMIAADSDHTASKIILSIPGGGRHSIKLNGILPSVNEDNTEILNNEFEKNPVELDFEFRTLDGKPFIQINGNNVSIKGLDFVKMYYNSENDNIIRIGKPENKINNISVSNCHFFVDAQSRLNLSTRAISAYQIDGFYLNECFIGTDISRKVILNTSGSIEVTNQGELGKVEISNCIFTGSKEAISLKGVKSDIFKNIFGAYDTTTNLNFLNPNQAIILHSVDTTHIINNFFIGHTVNAIEASQLKSELNIMGNKFYYTTRNIILTDSAEGEINVTNNFARNGEKFIAVNLKGSHNLLLSNNTIQEIDTFYTNVLNNSVQGAYLAKNTMTCIRKKVIALADSIAPKPDIPVITKITNQYIQGTSIPKREVIVYRNPKSKCIQLSNSCQGGYYFGSVDSDGNGFWQLNANIDSNAYFSCYVNELTKNGIISSEFSDCKVFELVNSENPSDVSSIENWKSAEIFNIQGQRVYLGERKNGESFSEFILNHEFVTSGFYICMIRLSNSHLIIQKTILP